MAEEKRKGLVLVFTGQGKGKTTAALGMALRAMGHGQQVVLIQFIKGSRKTGEMLAAANFNLPLTMVQVGLTGFTRRREPSEQDLAAARKGLDIAAVYLTEPTKDLVILDEINPALARGLIPTEELLSLLAGRPSHQHVVLTGRKAPREILALADMVSRIDTEKHHFQRGVSGQRGIEF